MPTRRPPAPAPAQPPPARRRAAGPPPPADHPLARYWNARNFDASPEPPGDAAAASGAELVFCVQKHAATRLHYDLRLELGGVLLSWAVPKGPSFDPEDKRVAIHVEDHPLPYASFEGTIPRGHYGAGTVIVWDRGTWWPRADPHEGLAQGKLLFELRGEKLRGLWELVRIAKPGDKQDPWILFKKRDPHARPRRQYDVLTALPDSVITKAAPGAGRLAAPAGAVAARLPRRLTPQLASPATAPPRSGRWAYEIKFDGYRLLARVEAGKARLFTRGGHDWTAKLPALAREVEALGLASAWLDGEIVVLDDRGLPSFAALQRCFDRPSGTDGVVYFVFDLPYLEGIDLRGAALEHRRRMLQAAIEGAAGQRIRFSADFDAEPASILASARAMGLEGLIAKRCDSPYVSRRTDTWLKLKCRARQEFVIIGYAERSGEPRQVGALMLGAHAGGELRAAGSVGTGWNAAEAERLKRLLAKIERHAPPVADAAVDRRRDQPEVRWVLPEVVAEVEFGDWSAERRIRHATFLGLREDKPAADVMLDPPQPRPGQRTRAGSPVVGKTTVTHPERVVDPASGITKLELVRYYESVAPWLLPHLTDRPVSLVRAPQGLGGELFFQKYDEGESIAGMRRLERSLYPGHPPLLVVPTLDALIGAAQMNVVEFHTWNSTARQIHRPDRIVFDLDPGERVPWPQVLEGALLVRTLLGEIELQSWLKTSGGKGLHVVVPIEPRLDYETVKAFSRAAVMHLAKTIPSRFVAKSGPANRVGRIFVDFLRNTEGATTAAAYSVRARPGLGVSMPVTWERLGSLKGGAQWTAANARDHLSFETEDPWAGYWNCRQGLRAAMRWLKFEA